MVTAYKWYPFLFTRYSLVFIFALLLKGVTFNKAKRDNKAWHLTYEVTAWNSCFSILKIGQTFLGLPTTKKGLMANFLIWWSIQLEIKGETKDFFASNGLFVFANWCNYLKFNFNLSIQLDRCGWLNFLWNAYPERFFVKTFLYERVKRI